MPKPKELAAGEEAELRQVENIAAAEVKSLEQLRQYLDSLRNVLKTPEQAKAFGKQGGDRIIKFVETFVKYSDKARKLMKDAEKKGVELVTDLRKQVEAGLKKQKEQAKKAAKKGEQQAVNEQFNQAIEQVEPYLQNLRVEAIAAAKEEVNIEQLLSDVEEAEKGIAKRIKKVVDFLKKGDVLNATANLSEVVNAIDAADQSMKKVAEIGQEADKQLETMLGALEGPVPKQVVAEHVEAVKEEAQQQ